MVVRRIRPLYPARRFRQSIDGSLGIAEIRGAHLTRGHLQIGYPHCVATDAIYCPVSLSDLLYTIGNSLSLYGAW